MVDPHFKGKKETRDGQLMHIDEALLYFRAPIFWISDLHHPPPHPPNPKKEKEDNNLSSNEF